MPWRRRSAAVADAEVDPRPPAPDARLWLDAPDAEAEAMRRIRDEELRRHAQEVIRDGVTIIRGAIPHALCDRVREDYRRHCEAKAEAAAHADAQGHHSRLSNFHLVSTAARDIGTDAGVMRVLDTLLGHRSWVYTCLIFEKSTQQAIHRDSPFFHSLPPGFFLGVWTALEDIDDRAGPLEYFLGGHRAPVDHAAIADQVRAGGVTDEDDVVARAYGLYVTEVARSAEAIGCRLTRPRMHKGDTLIWHPALPHSGGAIEDASLTRASIVFHCTPEGTPLLGARCFFGLDEMKAPETISSSEWAGRRYVDDGPVQFFKDI